MPVATVDYIRDVKPFDDAAQAWTDAEIAYQVSGQTIGEIATQDARTYHAENDWWDVDLNGNYEGELHAIMVDPSTPDNIRTTLDGVGRLLFKRSQVSMRTEIQLDQDDEARNKQGAGEVREALEYAVGLQNGVTQKEVRNYYNLGGGLKYKQGVTQEDIAQSRIDYNNAIGKDTENSRIKSLEQGYYNSIIAPLYQQQGATSETEVIAGYRQVADSWEADNQARAQEKKNQGRP